VETVTSGYVRLTRPQLTGTLIGLALALLLAALDQTIVGTAMPRIIAQLNGFERYPWVTTAYLLSSTLAVPVFARLSDLYGRKQFFLIGCFIFVASSGLCGAAGQMNIFGLDGMNQLILFRGIQGFGAGMITGLIFTIIGDIFSPAERGRYQGLFAAIWGLASIFGPTAGGYLTDQLSWRWTFYVNLPVGVIALIAIAYYFPPFHPVNSNRVIDWLGVGTLTFFLFPLLIALSWVDNDGWTSSRVLGGLAFAALMLGAFLLAESKAKEPILPLHMFRDPVITVSCIATFIQGMGMFGAIVYLPLFMQGVMGVSATRSGNLLTPLMMGAVVSSIATGQIISRTGTYKRIAIVSSIIMAAGMVLFARMDLETTQPQIVFYMILVGLGLGAMQPVFNLAVQNAAPRAILGAATASIQFFRSIGSTLGVAIFGSVFLSLYKQGFESTAPKFLPPQALKPFENPLLLFQIQPRLKAAFGQYPGGQQILDQLMQNVRVSLVHGLQVIFWIGAVTILIVVGLSFALREIKLKTAQEIASTPVMD
jgi:EmrB/QacA subfamily drug resistance transporter